MRRCLSLLLLIVATAPAKAWTSPAPDVVLYCPPALQTPLRLVATAYTAATDVPVHLFVAPPDGLRGLIAHRARADVVLADAATVAALSLSHLVRPGTVIPIGRDPFALIANAAIGPARPVADLVAAHPVVLPDATNAASFDGVRILHSALPGIAPLRLIGVADTPTVLAMVQADPGLLGLVTNTEANARGIVRQAILAAPPTPILGALVAQGQSANAGALLAFIAGPVGLARLRSSGLQAAP